MWRWETSLQRSGHLSVTVYISLVLYLRHNLSNMPPIIRRQEPERHFPDFEYSHLLDKADYGDWRDELVSPTQGYAQLYADIARRSRRAMSSSKALSHAQKLCVFEAKSMTGWNRFHGASSAMIPRLTPMPICQSTLKAECFMAMASPMRIGRGRSVPLQA